jgi:transcription elongation factor GreB
MSEKNYMTPKGHRKLVEELERLTRVERPEVTQIIQWAAGNGDRSENADYIYGKKRLREIDSRIRFLTKRLENAVVINPNEITSTKIQFGATVTVVDEDGNEKTYTIVGIDEVNTQKNHISWKSPIGNSLIGKAHGESTIVRAPSGEIELEIIKIWYEYSED